MILVYNFLAAVHLSCNFSYLWFIRCTAVLKDLLNIFKSGSLITEAAFFNYLTTLGPIF